MTTPAVNINSVLPGTGQFTVYYSDGSVYNPPPSPVHALLRRFRQRPESVSHPPNPVTGWRDPGSYYHRGYSCNPYPVGTIRAVYDYGTVVWDGGLGWTSQGDAPTPSVPDKVSSLAEARALANLKNQHVDLALAFAERKETAEFATDVLHGLTSLAKNLRRKNLRDWRAALAWNRGNTEDRLRKVPESYLAFMYAARPLQGDVYGACDALNSRERDPTNSPYVVNVKGKAKAIERFSYFKATDISSTVGFHVDVEQVFKAYVSLNYVLANPLTATLASLGITNPLALAWNRLPISFVADWFVPVGQYLGQLDADMGYEFRSGTISLKTTRTERSFFQDRSGTGAYTYSGVPWRYDGFEFVRGPYSDTPMPWTGLKNPLPKTSGTHLAEAIALLAANLR